MKKKGFTLIELLAVIVVLAIIALIATPIVMNTIKNSKKGAAERTADNYADQVETSLMTYRLENGSSLPDGTYSIDTNGNLSGYGKNLTIEMNGTKPSSGTIVIENGQVNNSKTSMEFENYKVNYNETSKTFVANEIYKGILCTAVTELSTQYVYVTRIINSSYGSIQHQTGVLASAGDPYAYGVEYSCDLGDGEQKTFYVIEDGDTTTLTEGRIAQAGEVSLIASMNIDSNGKGTLEKTSVPWISQSDYLKAGGEDFSNDGGMCQYGNACTTSDFGPITAFNYLKLSTISWSKLKSTQVSLPTYNQIYTASSNGTILSTWLVENLLEQSYWLADGSRGSDKFGVYWVNSMYDNNELSYGTLNINSPGSVRPVITISKSQLG